MYRIGLISQALITVSLTLSLPRASHAACFCEFINGVVQPMCSSSLDVRPSCGPPVRERWVTVVASPPPLRLESCRPAVICEKHGACRSKWVCD